jgi:N-acetylmuramoyl-L-alanine amidase
VNIRAPIGNKARADTALASRADGGPPGGCGFAILVPELVQTASTGHGPITGPWHRLADTMVRRFAAVTGQNVSTVPKVFTACANMRNAQDTVKVTSAHRRQLAARGSPIRSAPSPA